MNAAKTIVAVVEADTATANMPAVKERLNMLKETISDAETRGVISKDEDARTGHKTADSSFIVVLTHSQRVQLLLVWCSSCSVGALLALASGKAERRQVHPLMLIVLRTCRCGLQHISCPFRLRGCLL